MDWDGLGVQACVLRDYAPTWSQADLMGNSRHFLVFVATATGLGCGSGGHGGGIVEVPHTSTGLPPVSIAAANAYSWDGSWRPAPGEFPLPGLLDMDPSQQGLPPGTWGWDNACDCPGQVGTAIYDNEFVGKGLDFARLADGDGRHFGWRLIDTNAGDTDLDHRGDAFAGSNGVDIFDLDDLSSSGPGDRTSGINLGEGPDMLRFRTAHSLDMRTGATERGALFDNDLVILGSESVLPSNQYDIGGATVHTGPGSDLVFVRNLGQAGIDLGNGAGGRSDTLDRSDGDDMILLAGNMRDFRVFGGHGNDVFVWYVDEVVDDRFLGPNFYGAGGWEPAIWSDEGIDRLVMMIDPGTQVVHKRSEHDNTPGSLLSFVYADYAPTVDAPTANDVYARYKGTADIGPHNEHTITLSYRSADGRVFTHDFYITAVEEIQLGGAADARVFRVNQADGTLTPDASLTPITVIPNRAQFNTLFDTFAR